MTRELDRTATTVPAMIYAGVQHFYARQMGLLDEGHGDSWADTFTEDAVFSETRMPAPLAGREAIRASVHRTIAGHREAGRTVRHWFGMLVVESRADGSVDARSYALTIVVARGGEVTVKGHAVCHDILVGDGAAGWLVRRREIRPDGV